MQKQRTPSPRRALKKRRPGLRLRHFWQEIILVLLVFVLLFEVLILFQKEEAQADPDYPIEAYMTASQVSLREAADPASGLVTYMREGDKILIWDMAQGVSVEGNSLWYYVSYGAYQGWVTSLYVNYETNLPLNHEYNPAAVDFKTELKQLGFPESYLDDLYALHLKYPNWTFKPLYTHYSFQTAIEGELAHLGANLVPASSPDGYKSREPHEYSYLTNSWHEYEYGWVGASREILAHQMDPRNFLNETGIFQFENLQYNPTVQTLEGVYAILADSFMAGREGFDYLTNSGNYARSEASYGELFMAAADYANVNPYHLAARSKQELSPHGSDSSSGNYRGIVGYYNFFNVGAYASAEDADPVYNGLLTARDGITGISEESYQAFLFPWISPERAIKGGANFLGRDYINADQQTLYLQKFNLSSRYFAPFTHQYMANIFAPQVEAEGVFRAYQEIGVLGDAKEFLIPVFSDLPYYTPEPEYNGTPNNWLKSLSVNGQELPDFNYLKTSYTVELETGEPTMILQAEAFEAAAIVEGTGFFFLDQGENFFQIQVTATDGSVRLYDLTVRQKDVRGALKLSSNVYGIDGLGYLYGADPTRGLNTPSAFLNYLESSDTLVYRFKTPEGVETEGPLGTGSRLEVWYEDELVASYQLVIFGDVNGDGSIDVLDARSIARYNMGQVSLSPAELLAMDANRDGSGDLLDAKEIARHVTHGTPLSQALPSGAKQEVEVE